MGKVTIHPLGESAAVVRFGTAWSEELWTSIVKLQQALERQPFVGMVECVPALAALTVYYDPYRVYIAQQPANRKPPFVQVQAWLLEMMKDLDAVQMPESEEIGIPVVYGGEFGPDLIEAAAGCGLTEEEFIRRHTAPLYLVHMIGFAPGFPYLGGMDESIAVPRKSTPRAKVLAGSVGIAGKQTGIYSLDSPGGWNIIGRTPLTLFDPHVQPPTLLKAGMRLRFYPISEAEWAAAGTKHGKEGRVK